MANSKSQSDVFSGFRPDYGEAFLSNENSSPELSSFVKRHLAANQVANDKYSVKPLDEMVPGSKTSGLYMLHTYWSKKPFDAIEAYINHYTKLGNIVWDPFVGCGSTALVARRMGRIAIGFDVSPSAMRIACGYCNNHPFEELQSLQAAILKEIWTEISWVFELGDAFIRSVVVSESFKCGKCLRTVALAELGIEESTDRCPHCNDRVNSRTLEYIPNSGGPFLVEIQPKPLSARSSGSFKVGKSAKYDKNMTELYARLAKAAEPSSPPDRKIPQRLIDLGGRLASSGTLRVSQLHSKRQRIILGGIWRVIQRQKCSQEAKRSLEFLFSSVLINSTQMYRARKKGGVAGAYYLPPVRREIDTYRAFNEKYDDLLAVQGDYIGKRLGDVLLSRQSASDASQMLNDSVDYIFTDPPYADTMPFAALNAIYDYWFNVNPSYLTDEAIGDRWTDIMDCFFKESFRVLKPGRWLTLCYHDTSEGTWEQVNDLARKAGFITDEADQAVGIDSNQKAYQQTVGDKVTKRDLVINFRKPRPGAKAPATKFTGAEDQQTFQHKVLEVVREFLLAKPGTTKDHIYDQVISRLVSKGQMQAHNFDELLRQVADEVKDSGNAGGKWFLKYTEAGADEAERTTADSAGTRIHEFLVRTANAKLAETEPKFSELQSHLSRLRHTLQLVDHGKSTEPRPRLVREIRDLTVELDQLTARRAEWEKHAIHFSDIFEFYVSAVNPKPKARLEEILEDYCYQTDEGNWRPPLTEQEQKEKGSERQRAVRRTIQRFCGLLESGEAVQEGQRPDTTTLAEWIRHCRRTGLYAQGKLLYEGGGLRLDQLNEEDQVSVQEDYEVCVKRLVVKPTSNPNKQQNLNV
jgi:DNA-directed RNA polymerase subunit RPC12/RpoP